MVRVDDETPIRKVVLITCEEFEGDFKLVRGTGDLGYAGVVFVVGEGMIIPVTSVKYMEQWEVGE